jgi:hypothetical protein
MMLIYAVDLLKRLMDWLTGASDLSSKTGKDGPVNSRWIVAFNRKVRVNEKRYLRVNVSDAEMNVFTDPERRALEMSVEVERNEGRRR